MILRKQHDTISCDKKSYIFKELNWFPAISIRECVSTGAQTCRSLGHHLLHPLILRLLVLCAPAVFRPRALQDRCTCTRRSKFLTHSLSINRKNLLASSIRKMGHYAFFLGGKVFFDNIWHIKFSKISQITYLYGL